MGLVKRLCFGKLGYNCVWLTTRPLLNIQEATAPKDHIRRFCLLLLAAPKHHKNWLLPFSYYFLLPFHPRIACYPSQKRFLSSLCSLHVTYCHFSFFIFFYKCGWFMLGIEVEEVLMCWKGLFRNKWQTSTNPWRLFSGIANVNRCC